MKYLIFKMWRTTFMHQSEVVHWSSSRMNDTSLFSMYILETLPLPLIFYWFSQKFVRRIMRMRFEGQGIRPWGCLKTGLRNQKTKLAARYKILFCGNQTTFKYQSSKGENKKKEKRKKETSRNERVFANLHRNESNLLSLMGEVSFYMQVILSFFF